MVALQRNYYRVRWCPHDIYTAGARFHKGMFKSQLTEPWTAWPLGMILDFGGKILVVCGIGRLWRQFMDGDLDAFPPQWTVEISEDIAQKRSHYERLYQANPRPTPRRRRVRIPV